MTDPPFRLPSFTHSLAFKRDSQDARGPAGDDAPGACALPEHSVRLVHLVVVPYVGGIRECRLGYDRPALCPRCVILCRDERGSDLLR